MGFYYDLMKKTNFERNWDIENKKTASSIDIHIEGKTCIVLVKQTSGNPIGWWQNFRALQVPYKDMKTEFKAHKGFVATYKGVRGQFIKEIKEIDSEIDNYIITGYSQGGGVAPLVYEDMVYQLDRPAEDFRCVIYGSPRLFGKENIDEINKRIPNITRVEHGQDLVSQVPFKWMGYEHVGKLMHIGKKRLPFIVLIRGTIEHINYFYYKHLKGI